MFLGSILPIAEGKYVRRLNVLVNAGWRGYWSVDDNHDGGRGPSFADTHQLRPSFPGTVF